VQQALLSKLLFRDLSDDRHKTNVHMHYKIPYGLAEGRDGKQKSFFNSLPDSPELFEPLDPCIHKPLSLGQFLSKKLRWITLGGQYDWTNKVYPDETPPAFPDDIKALLGAVYPDVVPEAAIVNVYSPGDTLSLHRDVSEESDQALISISLGCDAIFVVGLGDGLGDEEAERQNTSSLAFRLRSGDCVYMSGASRYAWHGVAQIIRGTCPDGLHDWPASFGQDEQDFAPWKGWLSNKRINLNVRQMRD
jgi:alkylated DNA repair protein alkB family protein 1